MGRGLLLDLCGDIFNGGGPPLSSLKNMRKYSSEMGAKENQRARQARIT